MSKAELTNRIVSISMFWLAILMIFSSNWNNPGLLILVSIVAIIYTVYQLLGIAKEKK